MAGIVIGETQPLGRHAVEIGGLDDLLTVTTQVSVTEVIGHDVDDVRLSLFLSRTNTDAETEKKEEPGEIGFLSGGTDGRGSFCHGGWSQWPNQ